MKQTPLFFVILASSFVLVALLLSLLIWGAVKLLESDESDSEAPLMDQIIKPTLIPPPIATEDLQAPDVDMAAFAADLAAIEGVATVRVMEVKPFQGDWLIYLEIDTDRGYNKEETALAARLAALGYTGERMVFNVVLWDRVTTATNYTWDGGSQLWLTTPVLNNPG